MLLLPLLPLLLSGCIGNRKVHLLTPKEQRVIQEHREKTSKDAAPPTALRLSPGWVADEPATERGSDEGASLVVPEAHAGALYTHRQDALATASFEFFRVEIPEIGKFSLAPGLAYSENRTALFVALDREFPTLLGIEMGPFVGYEMEERGVICGFHIIGLRW